MSTKMTRNRSNFKDLYPEPRYTFRELRIQPPAVDEALQRKKTFTHHMSDHMEHHMETETETETEAGTGTDTVTGPEAGTDAALPAGAW